MMSYELFKKIIEERIKCFLPNEYKTYRVEIHKMIKVNRKLDCLNLMPPKDEDSNEMIAMPNIYLNEMYEEFKVCQDLDFILKKIASIIYHGNKMLKPTIPSLDFNNLMDNIVLNLINTEQNKDMLENIPHRELLDLSITYRFLVEEKNGGFSTILINNSLLKDIEMDEEELYQAAKENTKKMFPTKVKSMDEIFMELIKDKMAGYEKKEICQLSDTVKKTNMYVITNNKGINGAANIVFDEELFALSEKIESNFYILPSSIHEVIAISDKIADCRELKAMVKDANETVVGEEELLSNQVYYYDASSRSLSIAKASN